MPVQLHTQSSCFLLPYSFVLFSPLLLSFLEIESHYVTQADPNADSRFLFDWFFLVVVRRYFSPSLGCFVFEISSHYVTWIGLPLFNFFYFVSMSVLSTYISVYPLHEAREDSTYFGTS